MTRGIIELDSDAGVELGFTSADFNSGSYLWGKGDSVVVSFIWSKRKGAFRELAQRILAKGLTVYVPTPLGRMEQIVRKAGYEQVFVEDEEFGMVELWKLSPVAA